MTKEQIERKNKIFTGVFVFIVSVYLSTLIHEIGHAIMFFKYGCGVPLPLVSPFILGWTLCGDNLDFSLNTSQYITKEQDALLIFSGIFFVSIIGVLFLLIYEFWKKAREYYILSLILYFFSLSSLINGFLQSLRGQDERQLTDLLGSRPNYLTGLSVFDGAILIYLIYKFKSLLLAVEPKISQEQIKKWHLGFLVFLAIILILYFGVPYIWRMISS